MNEIINYLRLTTIRIVNPHGVISAIGPRQRKDDSVRTYTKIAVAELRRLLRCYLRLRRIPIINLKCAKLQQLFPDSNTDINFQQTHNLIPQIETRIIDETGRERLPG